jgi:hypothetical protein
MFKVGRIIYFLNTKQYKTKQHNTTQHNTTQNKTKQTKPNKTKPNKTNTKNKTHFLFHREWWLFPVARRIPTLTFAPVRE